MLVIKVVPENYGKILKRCKDLNQKFLDEHVESQRLLQDKTQYYAAPQWIDGRGRHHSYSILIPDHLLDEEYTVTNGKSDTDWFQVTRKKS